MISEKFELPNQQWILITVQRPEHGQLIVKYWKATGTVWAGRHIEHAKHESFDMWYALPEPELKGYLK